jgi:predicted DNA binding CopG/RHH family protein
MAVKPQIQSKIDLADERVKNFLRGGAPVLEDVLEDERKKEEKRNQEAQEKKRDEEESRWTMISMRIPLKLLKTVDEKVNERYMNRSAWIMEAIQKNLKE